MTLFVTAIVTTALALPILAGRLGTPGIRASDAVRLPTVDWVPEAGAANPRRHAGIPGRAHP